MTWSLYITARGVDTYLLHFRIRLDHHHEQLLNDSSELHKRLSKLASPEQPVCFGEIGGGDVIQGVHCDG